ncbi:MAG: hypothetical protein EOP06_24125 [Proteobacteria bacterium]|nr:MAG: hypothetical protein EOP06_24125 [Pseudomonadota bacterium]
MPVNQLPPVAKSFFAFCKKCDADRYHVVLAHTSAKAAKIKCEVCGSIKSYTLPKAAGSAKSGTKVTRPRAGSESARRSSHNAEYEAMINAQDASKETGYTTKGKFTVNQKINHPKFGLGVVRGVQLEKVEVVFADEVRNLVHNRE